VRRLARILLNALTVLSLLLCAATVALWVLGSVTIGNYGNPFSDQRSRGANPSGVQAFGYGLAFHSSGAAMRFHWHYIRRAGDKLSIGSMWAQAEPNWTGFAWNVAPTGQTAPNGKPWARQGTVAVPHWFVIVVSAALPGLWFRRRRRARYRLQRGLCPDCGYDLRATPERCPECGAVPGKSI
jgi:hypothetical protein